MSDIIYKSVFVLEHYSPYTDVKVYSNTIIHEKKINDNYVQGFAINKDIESVMGIKHLYFFLDFHLHPFKSREIAID